MSNLATPFWNIIASHKLPSPSASRSSAPVGEPGFRTGMAYSRCAPVLGSSSPRKFSTKFEYQTWPRASMRTSCGAMVWRGRSYSVMTTRVARPFGRGKVGSELAYQIVVHLALGEPRLHPRLRGVVGVLRHALEHGKECFGVVGRAHDALKGVAAHAFDQRPLLLQRAGHAHEPFGIGQLRREVGGLAQLDGNIGGCAAEIDRLRTVELIADGANAQRVMTGR